jgi:hypothetical protein
MFIKRSLPPLLVSLTKVWDQSPHNAFTDLLFAFGRFYLCFRESDLHEKGQNGIIHILTSQDGVSWNLAKDIEVEGLDLRDPKLSLTPDGRIMLNCSATKLNAEGDTLYTDSLVTFADEDLDFTKFNLVLVRDEWLWQVIWHQGIGYGVSYPTKKDSESKITLWETKDGLEYTQKQIFEIEGKPNETAIRFLSNSSMVLLVRRNDPIMRSSMVGFALPPYENFIWKEIGYHISGANFLIFPDNEMWVAGRLLYLSPYAYITKTALLKSTPDGFHRELILPSFGDTGYPGMIFHNGFLWISYYSTHEKNTNIYLAKILIP